MKWSRRRTAAFLLLSLISKPLFAVDQASAARQAWGKRDQPGQLNEAIALWKKAWAENPTQPELLIWLTKSSSAAYRHTDNREEKQRFAEQALRYGEEAVAKNPKQAEAHAYYAEALGQYAQAHKGFSSLHRVKQAVGELQTSLLLNPAYAYAHMLLASFYLDAPRGISVGDRSKALAEARVAVQDGPGVAINHLTLANVLLADGSKKEAEKELRAVLALTPPADLIPETHSDQKSARRLLRQLGDSAS